jgi:acyl-CoA hydrolase
MRQVSFQSKTVDLSEALNSLPETGHVVASMAACEPTAFFQNIHKRHQEFSGLQVHCANPTQNYPCFSDVSHSEHINFNIMFLTAAVRQMQGHNLVHYVPQHLSRWSHNLTKRHEVDVFWGSCSAPTKNGFVSLGVNACYEPDILRRAKRIVLEVNPRMPVVYGDTFVPIGDVDYFIINEHPLPTVTLEQPDQLDIEIAEYISELIPNGATLQLGIGGIPNAVGRLLKSKKDLGIHTELFTESMKELYEAGVITGSSKTIWPRKMVATFIYGSQALYEFAAENPALELHPASIINDPNRICRNHAMISVNTAVEVDITGQVCSESVGHRELSGVGGATDTHIGAQRSTQGRGIIALKSMTSNSEHSKIVFELKPGAKVSISRNDVDTVVTEFGVAELIGLSVAERAKALIRIAHPSVREELSQNAKKAGYI